MVAAQDKARAYQQKRYRSLDQAWVNWREQRLLARLLAKHRLDQSLVLDVPCGYGRFTPLFCRLGITAIGADVDAAMVHLAADNHRLCCPGHWVQASVFALPFADNTFDGVVCVRLLHHRYSDAERQRILGELARVTRRVVIFTFYRFTPLHASTRRWRGGRVRHGMLTLARLRALVQASGLQLCGMYTLLRFIHAQTFVVLQKDPVT